MSNTLTKLDLAPEWVMQIFREIDTLEFGPGFDRLTDVTEMTFGTAKVIGVEAIKAFFVKIDSPLNIEHRIHDFWDGDDEKILRGDAILSKKGSSDPKVTTPLMQIFTMDQADNSRVSRWFIVNGPINTDVVI